MESAQGAGGAARLMNSVYNEAVVEWSIASQSDHDFRECVQRYYIADPERFKKVTKPFTICDYGCTDGGASVPPLRVIIQAVREINPDMPVQVYLNDLPECRFDKTIDTITKGLKLEEDLKNVFLMASGKDFTTQVFPKNSVDIGFSTLTTMIISHAPAPITDNIFFVATNESVRTDTGKLWIEALQKHFKLFLEMRARELRPNGQLFVSTMIMNEPEMTPYQKKEKTFYEDIAQKILPEVLSKSGIKPTEETLSACMKTTAFGYPSHYHATCKNIEDKLSLIQSTPVDVPDIFHQIYSREKANSSDGYLKQFGISVSKYIKGFWCDILEEGLNRRLSGDPYSSEYIKKASNELFEEVLPKYVQDHAELYPECYQILKLSFQRTLNQ